LAVGRALPPLVYPKAEIRRQNLKSVSIQRKRFEGKKWQPDRPILATRLPPIFVWGLRGIFLQRAVWYNSAEFYQIVLKGDRGNFNLKCHIYAAFHKLSASC